MRIGLSNWWTAAVASALCVVLIVTIAILSAKTSQDTVLRRPSTFFTDGSGARAIYLVLQQVLPSVEQWRLPTTEIGRASAKGSRTLIAMGPASLGQREADVLDAWIAQGGQLILASNADWSVQKNKSNPAAKDFLARHDISSKSASTGSVDAAVIRQVGRGRIIYIRDSYAFSNRKLRSSDNAVWLADRCTEWGGGALFDEYHLGFGAQRGWMSLIGMFAVTPWGLVCGQLALAGLIYLFGCKRRFGRSVDELPPERTNPIQTVEAIGGLFQAAQARALSARIMHQYLSAHVSSTVGHHIDLMDEETRNRLAGPLRIGKADLDSYVESAKAATSTRTISDAELIQFAQKATAIARSFSHGVVRGKRSAIAG